MKVARPCSEFISSPGTQKMTESLCYIISQWLGSPGSHVQWADLYLPRSCKSYGKSSLEQGFKKCKEGYVEREGKGLDI